MSFTEEALMSELWPYILPLPVKEGRQYEVLLSLFKSKASVDIIRSCSIEDVTYQRDLTKKLPYSNKTILKRLGSLVSANVLSEGMEKSRKKRAWIKLYRLTSLGKWIKLLMTPPQTLPKAKIKELIGELLELHVEGAVRVCLEHRINPEVVKTAFEKGYHRAAPRSSTIR